MMIEGENRTAEACRAFYRKRVSLFCSCGSASDSGWKSKTGCGAASRGNFVVLSRGIGRRYASHLPFLHAEWIANGSKQDTSIERSGASPR